MKENKASDHNFTSPNQTEIYDFLHGSGYISFNHSRKKEGIM